MADHCAVGVCSSPVHCKEIGRCFSAVDPQSLQVRVRDLEEEVAISDKLLAQQYRLMDAIPACEVHGNRCLPHAIEWVRAQIAATAAAAPSDALFQDIRAYLLRDRESLVGSHSMPAYGGRLDADGQLAVDELDALLRRIEVAAGEPAAQPPDPTSLDMKIARATWWDGVARRGDPMRRPNLSAEAFAAGWEARGNAGVATVAAPVTERPVCTFASGCDCDVPRPLPQGNKAWHCPKQQEHAAKVWNSISVDEGRSRHG